MPVIPMGAWKASQLEGDEITYYQKPPPQGSIYGGPEVYAKESYQEALEKVKAYVSKS